MTKSKHYSEPRRELYVSRESARKDRAVTKRDGRKSKAYIRSVN